MMFHKTMDAFIIWSVSIIYFWCAHAQESVLNNTYYDSSRCNCSTDFQVPKCMYVSIGREHLNIDTKTIDDGIGGFKIGTISSFHFGQDNETVRFCFPSSPQLLHCELRKYIKTCYEVNNHILRLLNTDFSAALGDYYLDEDVNAYVCTEAIKADKSIPRCNYITVESDMYVELDNDSLYINATQSILARASYTIDTELRNVNICYPLTITFLNCNYHFYSSYLDGYFRLPNLKIIYICHYYDNVYGPDEYYSLNTKGGLRLCIKSSPLIEIILSKLYTVFEYISLVCLCVTLVYQLKTGQSRLSEKCLACYCVTMIAFYILRNLSKPEKSCHNYFVGEYLVSLSSLTWLTLTTFDIWKSFSSLKSKPNRRIFRNHKTFIYYSMYGWGSPVLLYISVLITNHFQEIFAHQQTISMPSCWFKEVWASFTFFYGPMLFLSGINTVLFVQTVRAFQREAKKSKVVRKNGKKQIVTVCIKLFFIMGVGLITRSILLSIQEYLYFHQFYISGVFNSTQGLAVFIVVMCKRDTMRSIRNQFVDMQLKWDKCTMSCKILRRKKETIPIYLVEENHMTMESKQIYLRSRAYILHDHTDGCIFNKRNETMLAQISNETQL